MTDLKATLAERGSNYGPFSGHAEAAQDVKKVLHDRLNRNVAFVKLPYNKKVVILEGIDMIAHKLGRIVNGDPTFADSWHDIAGYATITEKFVNEEQENA